MAFARAYRECRQFDKCTVGYSLQVHYCIKFYSSTLTLLHFPMGLLSILLVLNEASLCSLSPAHPDLEIANKIVGPWCVSLYLFNDTI